MDKCRYDVVALGEVLIDFACSSVDADGYPTLVAHPGGAPCNLLAALNKYGCSTAFIGKVGDDSFGHMLLKTLRSIGIETKGVRMDSSVFTTLAFVTLDQFGNREFSFARKPGADTGLRWREIDLTLIDQCRDFHFGTLSLTDEPSRTATRKAVSYAKQQGKRISFDPNLRKPLWRDLADARVQMEWGFAQANIVKISEEEVEFLWGCSPKEGASILHQRYGVEIVFVTLGERGCYYSTDSYAGIVRTPKGILPVDTTGAGDIFGGAALAGILQTEAELTDLSEEQLRGITSFACSAASLSTQKYGGISSIPEQEDVIRISKDTH
ncbi:MAG: carbohydrate kinase [Acetatifactor sp.]